MEMNIGLSPDLGDFANVEPASGEHRLLSFQMSDFLKNITGNAGDNFTSSNLHPISDVDIKGVKAALFFNSIIGGFMIILYEVLRRTLPAVYSGKRRRLRIQRKLRESRQMSHPIVTPDGDVEVSPPPPPSTSPATPASGVSSTSGGLDEEKMEEKAYVPNLPEPEESTIPFDWFRPVYSVSWRQVRMSGGLDAYMFLRYIRMCLRITAVSAFWGCAILAPIYSTGGGVAKSWYHYSMANIDQGSWRIWVPTIFMYLFGFYVFFVMRQEYRHFLELRMDFLGRGALGVHPQHMYSIMVEKVPPRLRSDQALLEYFEKLFPGKTHSACVVLNIPELETLSQRKKRVNGRLEKAIARYTASGERPTHIVGRPRIMCCGVEGAPLEWPLSVLDCSKMHDMEDDEHPEKGDRVDSISYYTKDLTEVNRQLFILQRRKARTAKTGQGSDRMTWITRIIEPLDKAADEVLVESAHENELHKSYIFGSDMSLSSDLGNLEITNDSNKPKYGSFDNSPSKQGDDSPLHAVENTAPPASDQGLATSTPTEEPNGTNSANAKSGDRREGTRSVRWGTNPPAEEEPTQKEDGQSWLETSSTSSSSFDELWKTDDTNKKVRLIDHDHQGETTKISNCYTDKFGPERELRKMSTIGSDMDSQSRRGKKKRSLVKRAASNLGLDFFMAGLKFLNARLHVVVDSVVGATISTTGFVTFLDHASAACASGTTLTHKPSVLDVKMAPEPRDIVWHNAHIDLELLQWRESTANFMIAAGAVLWSFPLAFIQAIATAEQVAKIPGMDWILTIEGGEFGAFINGYLPVVALLGLILLLPLIFQTVATKYENRKTYSGIQESMVGRYFYYQLANIYITVTAGSLWKSLASIIDHPTDVLRILGESLPLVVGYFISLLVTKLLAGLPMVILRVGALSRMIFLRVCFSHKSLTQNELDEIYKEENLKYGWEYPTQLLVIVICFTYAVITPVILPVGAVYFFFALIVYKKQVLYVYTPTYESGGALFPMACDRTILGLICGQFTFLGYSLIRGGYYQSAFQFPCVMFSFWMMYFFRRHFAEPSKRLSLERAAEWDHTTDLQAANAHNGDNTDVVNVGASIPKLSSTFKGDAYRQPVLTEPLGMPLPYRRGEDDELTSKSVRYLETFSCRFKKMSDEGLGNDFRKGSTISFKELRDDDSYGIV